MTALETLIRTASNDGAAHYRELALNANLELLHLRTELDTYRKHLKAVRESPYTPTNVE